MAGPVVRVERYPVLDARRMFAQGEGGVRELRAVEHHARRGIVEQRGQFGRGQPPVERLQDRAQLAAGKPYIEIFDRIMRQHGHAVAPAHAEFDQPVRGLVRRLVPGALSVRRLRRTTSAARRSRRARGAG